MNLNQITLPAANVQASIDFYVGMGFELIVDSAPRYARFLCPQGQATFSVHAVEAISADTGVTTYFECADLDGQYRKLLEQGYAFTSAPTDQSWLWREARLKDPSGNGLCLFHAGRNRIDPPWRVSAAAALGSPGLDSEA